MMQSQNGWSVVTSSQSVEMVPLSWVTGRIRAGDVHAILDAFCARFNSEVEPITAAWSWGYAYRAIRGSSTGYSNHASGTAIDLNAPMHPLGKSGTFSGQQVSAIRHILTDLGGVVRWGGDYSGRKDEMHFEVIASPARLVSAVAGIGHTSTPAPVVTAAAPVPLTLIDPTLEEPMHPFIMVMADASRKARLVRPDLIGEIAAKIFSDNQWDAFMEFEQPVQNLPIVTFPAGGAGQGRFDQLVSLHTATA